jgi:hypothetical protein
MVQEQSCRTDDLDVGVLVKKGTDAEHYQRDAFGRVDYEYLHACMEDMKVQGTQGKARASGYARVRRCREARFDAVAAWPSAS